jgi:DNA-binding NtrC family response regulator
VLEKTHAATDERTALTVVCEHVRVQLRAAAVAFVAAHGKGFQTVAADGARLDPGLAARVLAADRLIVCQPADSGAEAGMPVRYGGRPSGVILARWPAGHSPDQARVEALLLMGAAVAAPMFAAIMSQLASGTPPADGLVGASDAMTAVRQLIERAAAVPFAVLIEGESGSGKELVARALHRSGPRRDRAFCAVNCAALPDELFEAELFGHARGAFTGALAERTGVVEEAHGGTLFLDEVGELSLRAQAKLLRTLQEGEIRRVGENLPRRVDVRVVAATNRNLRQEVSDGRFRPDLLYRLDVVRITVPPLRERIDDVPLLIERCWQEAAARAHSRALLSAATVAALTRYPWPGNVRELQNVLAALAVRAPRRGLVAPGALPPHITSGPPPPALRLDEARRSFEERFVRAALARAGGRRTQAAHELGISRQGLTKMLSRLGLSD